MLGINILYELALVFLLFQDLDTARGYMKLLDPSLGVPLVEKDYSRHCDFTFRNVWVCTIINVDWSPNIDQYAVEHNRLLLLRTYPGVVWEGVDFERLLVLLGANDRSCYTPIVF